MLILRPHRYGTIMPLPRREWQRDRNQEFWHIEARLHDGALAWRGYFYDREDADAFLLAAVTGSLRYERELWPLSVPRYEPLPYPATWQIFTNVALTTTSASNQTYTVPGDYVAAGSVWNVIAAGGAGAVNFGGSSPRGGGGGGFSRAPNIALGATAAFRLTAGGVIAGNGAVGGAGGDCWFNGSTLAASSVGAKGGLGGASGTAGLGGDQAAGIGSLKFSGGRGGNIYASGGGAAAGQDGNGNNGGDGASGATAGGAGDAGLGGAGGAPGGLNVHGTPGSPGANLAPGFGSGGGGGGSQCNTNGIHAGAGGLYGGAGGGMLMGNIFTSQAGAGAQGLIFGVYSVAALGQVYGFNRAGPI